LVVLHTISKNSTCWACSLMMDSMNLCKKFIWNAPKNFWVKKNVGGCMISRSCAERTLSSPVLKDQVLIFQSNIAWQQYSQSNHFRMNICYILEDCFKFCPPWLADSTTLARKERKKERKRLSMNDLPPLDCKHACDIQKPTTFLVQTRWNFGSILW